MLGVVEEIALAGLEMLVPFENVKLCVREGLRIISYLVIWLSFLGLAINMTGHTCGCGCWKKGPPAPGNAMSPYVLMAVARSISKGLTWLDLG